MRLKIEILRKNQKGANNYKRLYDAGARIGTTTTFMMLATKKYSLGGLQCQLQFMATLLSPSFAPAEFSLQRTCTQRVLNTVIELHSTRGASAATVNTAER